LAGGKVHNFWNDLKLCVRQLLITLTPLKA
jgi:hypothetical protein